MRTYWQYAALACLVLGGILSVALQIKVAVVLFGLAVLFGCATKDSVFSKHFGVLLLSFAVLAFTPITTDTSTSHMLLMGVCCASAVLLPHLLLYKSKTLRWRWFSEKQWSRSAIGYLVLAVILATVILPWYFHAFPSVPAKWPMPKQYSTESTLRLFIGTNALGFWDELFFINTVFVVLLRFFPFWVANVSQALLFTGFLYELGFIAIGPLLIFPFTLLQGLAFRRTESITYVIILHLLIDAVLFLTIMEYYYPGYAAWLPF